MMTAALVVLALLGAPEPSAHVEEPGKPLLYAGVATLGAGAILAGAGAYYAARAHDEDDQAIDASWTPGPSGKVEAVAASHRANRDTDRANLAFLGAGLCAVTGGLLTGLHVLIEAPVATVVPTPGGAVALVSFGF